MIKLILKKYKYIGTLYIIYITIILLAYILLLIILLSIRLDQHVLLVILMLLKNTLYTNKIRNNITSYIV